MNDAASYSFTATPSAASAEPGLLDRVFGRFAPRTLGLVIIAMTIVLIIVFVTRWRAHKTDPETRKLNRRERREMTALEDILNKNADNTMEDGNEKDGQEQGTLRAAAPRNSIRIAA